MCIYFYKKMLVMYTPRQIFTRVYVVMNGEPKLSSLCRHYWHRLTVPMGLQGIRKPEIFGVKISPKRAICYMPVQLFMS